MLGSLLFLLAEIGPMCSSDPNELRLSTRGLEHSLQLREYSQFSDLAKKNPWYSSSKNKLLLNLDSGIADILCEDYKSGTGKLLKVSKMGEEYYTKSITRNILSVLTNDMALPYYGEDYELTFAGNLAATAFAAAGDLEGALIESRRSEHRLSVLSSAYEGKKKYSDDAFAHYLAGLLFESSGNYNDAVVSYKRAYNSYGGRFFPMRPDNLTRALIGASVAGGIDPGFGFQSLTDSLKQTDLSISMRAIPDSAAAFIDNSMIFVAFTGNGPQKVEHVLSAHFTDDGIDHVIKIAIPEMKKKVSSISSVRIRVADGEPQQMELAADYNHIGVNAFKDKRNFIYAKTVARVSVRYLALRESKEKSIKKLKKKYEKIKEEDGEDSRKAKTAKFKMRAASIGLDLLANELLEHADTRCSIALPGAAFIARVPAPADSQRVTVEYLDRSGSVLDTEERTVFHGPDNGNVSIFSALF